MRDVELDAIFILLENYIAKKKDFYFAVVDLEKAFDQVAGNVLK